MYQVPILLIIFRRKSVALQSLERIRKIQPAKLYIAGDGARSHVEDEQEAVEETRKAVLDAIDWPCDVHTLFQEQNLGCSKGVYTAINWLFENEEQGIILEDDCMMQESFFPFVEELLERYKNDERIGMIDGANYIKEVSIPDSYGFSRYKATNGWATWRRAWKNMDLNMDWRQTPYADSIIANMGYRSRDIKYWQYRINVVDHNDVSAWDWQWYFTLAAHNQLGIYPCCSLQQHRLWRRSHTYQQWQDTRLLLHRQGDRVPAASSQICSSLHTIRERFLQSKQYTLHQSDEISAHPHQDVAQKNI